MNTATVKIEQLPGPLRTLIQTTDCDDPCWRWTGRLSKKGGYGLVGHKPQQRAHRVVYETLVEPIPEGFVLHHRPTCPKDCVNPTHVQAIPKETHTWLHSNENKTECNAGHAMTEENRLLRSDGTSRCKPCEQERWRQTKREKRRVAKLNRPVATLEMM